MRAQATGDGLTVQAIAGTHTVLLGFDLGDPTGCLGFGIHRQDHHRRRSVLAAGHEEVPQPGS